MRARCPDILVATPRKLLYLLGCERVKLQPLFDDIRLLLIDNADVQAAPEFRYGPVWGCLAVSPDLRALGVFSFSFITDMVSDRTSSGSSSHLLERNVAAPHTQKSLAGFNQIRNYARKIVIDCGNGLAAIIRNVRINNLPGNPQVLGRKVTTAFLGRKRAGELCMALQVHAISVCACTGCRTLIFFEYIPHKLQ